MKQILPALAAVSGACSLVALPAAALELGELTVQSQLGQPLRASIAYALQPQEQLHEFCIALKPGVPGNGLPTLSRATISVTENAILLTGNVPIREPMLGLQLSINCQYTAHLQRDYTLFVNPKNAANESTARAVAEASEPAAVVARPAARRASPGRLAVAGTPVAANSRYMVQPGDSASTIVARISDRPPGLWAAVDVIFAANPQAFIDGDVNLIKAGSWLDIPDLNQALLATGSPNEPAAAPLSSMRDAHLIAGDSEFDSPKEPASKAFDSGFSGTNEITNVDSGESAHETVESIGGNLRSESPSPGLASQSIDLRPGDVVVGNDSPFVSPIESSPTLGERIAPLGDGSDAANSAAETKRAEATPNSRDGATGSWSLLAWLGGAGLAVFAGMLLFGRRIWQQFGSTPIADVAPAASRPRQAEPERRSTGPAADVDFAFDTVSSSTPSMSLDVDLDLGTGFRNGGDMDVAQDFGFSTSDDLASDFDFEFPPGAADEPEAHPTDVIPPQRNMESLVVDSEIPPSDDDDNEYDLSMIVDATRQPVVDAHLTARDLKAVPVSSSDDERDADYTLSRHSDYKILEQDYEEEFTTTQALNEEIARVALELAENMARDNSLDKTAAMQQGAGAEDRSELTAELPAHSDNEVTAELTANLLAQGNAVNDDRISDLDDTGVNEELTAELPHADNDVTIEMEVEGGRIDTKKTRAS